LHHLQKKFFSFPAGIKPARESRHASPLLKKSIPPKPAQPTPPPSVQPPSHTLSTIRPLLNDLLSLLKQYSNLCNLLQTIVHKKEEQLAANCLSVIHSSISLVQAQVSITSMLHATDDSYITQFSLLDKTPILQFHTKLWHQLFFPHSTEIRRLTYDLLVQLEQIIHLLLPGTKYKTYTIPSSTSTPSVTEQIIYRPISILDPYILALRRNYYYPIAPDLTMSNDAQMEGQTESCFPKHSPKRSTPSTKHPITVESSLAAITEIIKEVEADDPPTEKETAPVIVESGKKYHTHRFAIYRKQTYPTPGAPPNQLALFQSFVRSIKSADHAAKIQPI